MPHNRYDLTRYDVGKVSVKSKERVAFYSSEFAANAGIAAETLRAAYISCNVSAAIELAPCWFRVHAASGSMFSEADVRANRIRLNRTDSVLDSAVNLNKVQTNLFDCDCGFDSYGHLSAIRAGRISILNSLETSCVFAYNRNRTRRYSAAFAGVLEVVSTISKEFVVNIAIPAGSTLVIDYANYTVYLDGVNVYRFQQGDWLRISRDTISLAIDSGTGGSIQGTASYVERYL